MRFRMWHVAALGLTGLLGLIAFYGVTTVNRASVNFGRLDALYSHYRSVELRLHRLRSDVNLSAIYTRDYLLDPADVQGADYQGQLAEYRRSNLETLEELRGLLPDAGGNASERIETLQASLEAYWQVFDPLFDWTPAERAAKTATFLRQNVVPRREEVLGIAREIEELASATLTLENQETTRQYTAHLGDMMSLLWQTLALGVIVAAVSVNRFHRVEQRALDQRERAEAAGVQLRALSLELVATQEEERKQLSRELHDHVGQMLTGLRMELGRIERLGPGSSDLPACVADSRRLVDEIMGTVRDLAMGLRPSMLDDFGLQPALEWLVRDFSRRSRMQATSTISADLGTLSDSQRTCVFRAVQEALTNCARHSGASHVAVRVATDHRGLTVVVRDNGVGISSESRVRGLGLRGLDERAKELGGTLTIDSGFGTGTTIQLWLPLSGPTEVRDASSAG